MTSKEALERILKLIASGELPKDLYNKYLSDTPIGFMSFEKLKEYFNLERLEVLEKENEILKMSVKDTYDTGQEIIGELTQENEKLKKAIEIFKHFKTEFEEGNGYVALYEYGALCIDSTIDLTNEEYELISEVLESE